MSTQKRRVIYIPDEEWARLLELAEGESTTVSAIIREALTEKAKRTARAKKG